MKDIFTITTARLLPTSREILTQQGVPATLTPRPQILDLAERARDEFNALVEASGMLVSVDHDQFANVFFGEGQNAAATPLADIHPRAEQLALFVVTIGEAVCARIRALFDQDCALATMLDAAASLGADRASDRAVRRYRSLLTEQDAVPADTVFMAYSPGYCGWHVSAQHRLFARLQPAAIGVTLRGSSLMQPLKSVSGVIVGGPADIHRFDNQFPFCNECETRSCRDRIAGLTDR